MTPDEFYAAQILEDEGWKFRGVSDAGDLLFTRFLGGINYGIEMNEDR